MKQTEAIREMLEVQQQINRTLISTVGSLAEAVRLQTDAIKNLIKAQEASDTVHAEALDRLARAVIDR